MPDHPKILELVDHHADAGMAAAFVWVCSLAYCGKHGLNGFVTKNTLARLNGKVKHANLLVQVGLWKDEGIGWSINGWAEYQAVTDEAVARSQKARDAALKRWGKAGAPDDD
jgi:hypothetical protein